MLTIPFQGLSSASQQQEAMESGACLVQKKGQDRQVKNECLLINVTGLTPSAIEDLAQASLNAVKAAKGE